MVILVQDPTVSKYHPVFVDIVIIRFIYSAPNRDIDRTFSIRENDVMS